MKGKTLSALMCAGLMAPGFAFAQGFGDGMRGNEDAEMQQRRQDPGRLHPQDQGEQGQRQGEQQLGQQDQQQRLGEQPGQIEQAGDVELGKDQQQSGTKMKRDQEQVEKVGGISLEDYQQQAADGQQQRQPRFFNVKGKLVDLKAANIKGEGEHLLAKLETEQGKTIVLDLGKLSNLEQQGMKPKQFQQIEARGTPGRLNKMPILIVDRYLGDDQATLFVIRDLDAQQLDGQVVQEGQKGQKGEQLGQQDGERTLEAGAPREDEQAQQRPKDGFFEDQGQSQQQPQQMGQQEPRTVLLRGRLIETRDVQLQGISDKHRLAKLRMRNGRTAIVDLGTKDQLEDIKLSNGEWIAVTGELGRINDKPVVFATHVADVAKIDRSGESRTLEASTKKTKKEQKQLEER